jgi:exopolysaccharide biosynthesis operon protein EpsL
VKKAFAASLCALAACSPAAAQDVLQLTAGASLTWDDNVFRQPGNGESDRFAATYVGLRFDKPYVQQRFFLDLTQTVYNYDRNSHLDFDATQYRAAWHWRASERLSGTLSADRSQSLVNYGDFRDPSRRNLRTTENRALTADSWIIGGWHLASTLLQQESRNSVSFLQERGFRQRGGDFGVKYLAGSGSTLAVLRRWLSGEYLERGLDAANLIDDAFLRTETEAVISWVLTGRSVLEGRLARIEYESVNFEARDFTGTASRLAWRWTPAARISLNAAASRDVSPSSDAFRRRVEERLSVGGSWELGPRTTLKAGAYRGTSEYREPVLPFAGAPRDERFSGWSLGWDWQVHRLVTLSASVQRLKRTSNDAAFEFRGTTATLGASLVY